MHRPGPGPAAYNPQITDTSGGYLYKDSVQSLKNEKKANLRIESLLRHEEITVRNTVIVLDFYRENAVFSRRWLSPEEGLN